MGWGIAHRRGRVFLLSVLAVVAALTAVVAFVAVPAYLKAVGPQPVQASSGPTGLPEPVYPVPDGTADVRDRPIEAASVVLDEEGAGFGLVSADGRAYRSLAVTTPIRRYPVLSPDGRSLAWWDGQEYGREVHVLRLVDAHESILSVPRSRGRDLQWYPDGQRLLATVVAPDGRPASWTLDVGSGAAKELCHCGRLLLSTSGALAEVPLWRDPQASLPPGVIRLPSATTDADVVVAPDARSWASVEDVPSDVVAIGGITGPTRRISISADPLVNLKNVLAWTADGLWLKVDTTVRLMDPNTGRSRVVLTSPSANADVVDLAVSLTTSAATVSAAKPPSARFMPAALRQEAKQIGGLLHFLFIWLPVAIFGRVVYGLILAAVVVAWVAMWLRSRRRVARVRRQTPS